MGFWWPWCLFYCFIIIWASVGLSTVKVCTSIPAWSAQFSVYWVLLKWVFVLDAGLALLRFRERLIRDPYGVLGNWNSGGGEDGDDDPCSWFGVECSDGKVISLWVFISLYVLLLLYLIFPWLNQTAQVILFFYGNKGNGLCKYVTCVKNYFYIDYQLYLSQGSDMSISILFRLKLESDLEFMNLKLSMNGDLEFLPIITLSDPYYFWTVLGVACAVIFILSMERLFHLLYLYLVS